MDKQKRIIVVGGGAAGLMAAGQAAEAGAEVLVLEKMKLPGRKICISGKGRCNLTNIAELSDFISHFGRSGKFLRQPFNAFFSTELIDFFESHGLALVKERGGRVFPASGKAPEVLKTMQQWLTGLGVSIRTDSRVESLMIQDGRIQGVICNGNAIPGNRVILATGGASYPATGSSGDGYRLAEAAGHTVIPIRPGLVPVETRGNLAYELAGLHLRNVGVRLLIDVQRRGKKKKKTDGFGELLFMKYGLSGPIILTLSNEIVDALRAGSGVELVLDLKPALNAQKLDNRLQRDFCKRNKESMDSVLRGLIPREMVAMCLGETEIDAHRLAGEVRAKERKRLCLWLKNIPFTVTGYRGFKEAIITNGGIDVREVDPHTMESKCCSGLYLTGELLDLQADTGGYNLQAAFSTGWQAGRAAADL